MTPNSLKVSIIEPVGGHGGMNYYDFGLCEGLAKAGVEAILYTCNETQIPSNAPFTVKLTFKNIYGTDSAWRRGLRYVRGSLRALLHTVSSGRSICHLHFFHVGPLEMMNVVLAKLLRRRVVITAHDVESFVSGLSVHRFSQLAYRLADRVIAHNQASKNELMDILSLPERKIEIIPHGNYLHSISDVPDRSTARKHLGLSDESKVVLFFGQIKEVKRLDLLLQAMPDVVEAHPETTLLIAGKTWKTDFSSYEKMIDELGLAGRCVTHIGYIPDREVAFYYAAADLVVLPYRRIYQSGVLLMAMSYGKPILASNLEGMSEVVTDGETGFLFPSGDTRALAKRLIEVLAEPEALRRTGESGYRHVMEHYSWAGVGEQTSVYYRSVFNRPNRLFGPRN